MYPRKGRRVWIKRREAHREISSTVVETFGIFGDQRMSHAKRESRQRKKYPELEELRWRTTRGSNPKRKSWEFMPRYRRVKERTGTEERMRRGSSEVA